MHASTSVAIAIAAAVAAQVVSATPSAADARSLHGLRSTVANLDRFGALPPRYWDGERVILANPSATQYVRKHLARISGDVKACDAYLGRMTPAERGSAEVKELVARVERWRRTIAAIERSLESAATAQTSGDAQCRAFKDAVMTNKRMYSVLYVDGRSPSGGGDPGPLTEVVSRVKEVAAVCAKPQFRDVGKSGCHWLKNGDFDPEMWCAVAGDWKSKLKKRIDADVAAKMSSFDNRPLISSNLKGEQNMQFFAGAVPNADGWREITSWKDMYLSDAIKSRYLDRIRAAYKAIEVDRAIDESLLAPIERAFAQLRADAEAAAPGYRLPARAGSDYSVGLAKKQIRKTGARVLSAFLGRASWRVHKNALGVPLSRSKPGYVLYRPRGQKLCQLAAYTLSETFDGRRYQRARGVKFGAIRFQSCRD